MAAPTDTFIDPASGAANGNDHGGAGFVDGSFANATLTLTKIGAFPAATCQAGDKLYLDDNGTGEVTPGLYTISVRTDNDNVVLTADIRSGAPDPTDVRCDNHTGAVGLPWATVQHALDFTTRDAVDGDRFNVKAGTDDVLAAALIFTTYGTPTAAAPWISQGYTTAAGDRGIGGISGGGNFGMIASATLDFLIFIDMHLHNSGGATIVAVDNSCNFIHCEIDNTTGIGLDFDGPSAVINCHIHNCGSIGVNMSSGGAITAFCTLENGANNFTNAISVGGWGNCVLANVFNLDNGSVGISVGGDGNTIMNNSVFSDSGTGEGIVITAPAQGTDAVINNIIEGFSGVGGVGIQSNAGSEIIIYGFNAFYNNTTNLTQNGDVHVDLSANDQTLAASPFIDAANDDFRVKPSVQALGYPTADYPSLAVRSYLDIGALQRQSQMLVHLGMSGGARG